MEGREIMTELGFARNPGESGCLPDGEVSFGPAAGSANGVLYVDGPIANIGRAPTPVKLVVKSGRITAVEGNSEEAGRLEYVIRTIENADNFAEIAIGLNPKSQRTGEFNEEKKGLGNIHIACGRSAGSHRKFDVWSTIHYDMVIYNPTIELDGRTIVDKGKHVY
jgi:leucyl aminopeptidase (aminopeptidase T)